MFNSRSFCKRSTGRLNTTSIKPMVLRTMARRRGSMCWVASSPRAHNCRARTVSLLYTCQYYRVKNRIVIIFHDHGADHVPINEHIDQDIVKRQGCKSRRERRLCQNACALISGYEKLQKFPGPQRLYKCGPWKHATPKPYCHLQNRKRY